MNEKAKQKARLIVDTYYQVLCRIANNPLATEEENEIFAVESAKECAKIAVNLEYDAKVEAFNQMSEFQPDIAAQAVFYANQEREQVLTEIDNL